MGSSTSSSVGVIPEAVRFQAENLAAVQPDPPPELPMELVRTGRFCLFVTPMMGLNIVDTIRLDESDVENAVEEVRSLLRERGRFQAAWCVLPSSTPVDLKPRLLALGMTPYEDATLEPFFTAMAIVSPPSRPAPGDVEVREVGTHDDMDAFCDVEQEALGLTADDWRPMREMRHLAFDVQQEGRFPSASSLRCIAGNRSARRSEASWSPASTSPAERS